LVHTRPQHAPLGDPLELPSGETPPLVSGKYEDRGENVTVEFINGKAHWAVEGHGEGDSSVKQDEDKITFDWFGRPLVLTQNPDGTLTSDGDDQLKLTKRN
jgi:hypothetical protein